MMLRHRTIPSQRGFVEPNPALDLTGHAFAVATRGTGWEPPGGVRRALVNAFGLGGSNAVVVLEEAPALPPRETAGGPQLLVLSARDRAALDESSRRLADHLAGHPDLDLADVAFTLQSGRTAFGCRRVLVAQDLACAVRSLRDPGAEGVRSRDAVRQGAEVSVVVPDALASDPEAGALLSAAEPAFRAHLADGFRPALKALLSSLGADVEVVAGDPDGRPALTGRLTRRRREGAVGGARRDRPAVADRGRHRLVGAAPGQAETAPAADVPVPTSPVLGRPRPGRRARRHSRQRRRRRSTHRRKNMKRIGVIGAGVMGLGVTQSMAAHGHEVVLVDVDEAALDRVRQRLASDARLARLLGVEAAEVDPSLFTWRPT